MGYHTEFCLFARPVSNPEIADKIAEALHALQNHARRLVADRAVRCILNDTRRLFDQVDGFARSGGIEDRFQQGGQLSQPNAAGDAFSAGLRVAQTQERQRHIDRAEARRAGADTVFDITVKAFYNSLRPPGSLDG